MKNTSHVRQCLLREQIWKQSICFCSRFLYQLILFNFAIKTSVKDLTKKPFQNSDKNITLLVIKLILGFAHPVIIIGCYNTEWWSPDHEYNDLMKYLLVVWPRCPFLSIFWFPVATPVFNLARRPLLVIRPHPIVLYYFSLFPCIKKCTSKSKKERTVLVFHHGNLFKSQIF